MKKNTFSFFEFLDLISDIAFLTLLFVIFIIPIEIGLLLGFIFTKIEMNKEWEEQYFNDRDERHKEYARKSREEQPEFYKMHDEYWKNREGEWYTWKG